MSSGALSLQPTLQPIFNTTLFMGIIFLLILISLLVALGFLLAYLWATRTGQFDDDYTPSVRMLFDDELVENEKDSTP